MRYREILNELTTYRDKEEYQTFMQKSAVQSKTRGFDKGDLMSEFLDYLKTKGYQSMGSGAFGAVFTHPNINYVVKVFKKDPAYIKFMKFAQKNASDPHLPKFRGKWMTVDKTHYCVRMEKLSSLNNYTIAIALDAFARSNDTPAEWLAKLNSHNPAKAKRELPAFEKQMKALQKQFANSKISEDDYWEKQQNLYFEIRKRNDVLDNAESTKRMLAFYEAQPGILETIEKIRSLKYGFDLHQGNMMMRGDVLVLTDPIYSKKHM